MRTPAPAYRLLLLTVLLNACSGVSQNPRGAASTDTLPGVSSWTALGTRSTASAANPVMAASPGAKWTDYTPVVIYPKAVTTTNQFITMDDGVRLAANITQPADAAGKVVTGPLPVILSQTTYNKDSGGSIQLFDAVVPEFPQQGYVHVVVDVRGTGRSEGQWEAFSAREQQDYGAVVDWVTQQPWSDGRIGLHGISAWAITAMHTAAQQHAQIKSVFAIVPMADAYRDVVAVGGQGSFMFLAGWLTAVTGLSIFDTTFYESPDEAASAASAHTTSAAANFQYPVLAKGIIGDETIINDGEFWSVRSPVEKADRINVPVFIVGGLHDVFQRGEPRLYEVLKRNATAKLLLGPWDHLQASVGQGLPTENIPALNTIALMWFDHYIKGVDNGAQNLPNVTRWVWGDEHYRAVSDWPHPQARAQRMYFGGDGGLSAQPPASGAAPKVVAQEPLNGICSQSGSQMTLGILGMTMLPCYSDDRVVNALEIVYETAPLTEALLMDGPIEADLWISTTADDTGVVVRVSDVAPDGTAFNLSNGMVQASLRAVDASKSRYLDGQMIQPWHPFTVASKQPVGSDPIAVAVEIWPTSALILPGHKLRVAVGPSNYPASLPPLPTLATSAGGVLSVYNDAEHPSSVLLPLVPTASLK